MVSVSELCAEREVFEGHRVSLELTRDDVSIRWFVTTLIACDDCCNATKYRYEVVCGDDPIALWPVGVPFDDAFELEAADTELTCASRGLGPLCPAEHCFEWVHEGPLEGRVVESEGLWYLVARR